MQVRVGRCAWSWLKLWVQGASSAQTRDESGAAYKSVRLCVSAYMSLVVGRGEAAATGRGC